jgi:hypothetical protein
VSYNATGSLVRFEHQKNPQIRKERSSSLERWRCSSTYVNSKVVGWPPGFLLVFCSACREGEPRTPLTPFLMLSLVYDKDDELGFFFFLD